VSLSASYQSRDSGVNRAGLFNGYQGPYLGSAVIDGQTLPQPGQPGAQNITNRPAPDALYSIPQNRLQLLGHPASAHQRPADLQFRPVKELTTTVDYTYSEQKIQTKRSELGLVQTPTSTSSWPSGHVVSPLTYQEVYPTPQDIGGGRRFRHQDQEQVAGLQHRVESHAGPESGV
jgi:hypothetical protein